MKVLVTGGAGYKGVKLTQRLLELGHDVTILDNFMYGFDSVLHLMSYKRLSVIHRDIRIEDYGYIKSADAIFHLAAISGYPACEANPHSAKLINVDATREIVRRLSKDQLFVYASTTSFYGKSGAVCHEETPVEPLSVYAITKHQAERVVMERENSISLRFATVFGPSPKMRIDLLVNDFVYRAMTERALVLYDSITKRTFVHIDDAITGYVFALENAPRMAGKVYNLGSDSLNFSKMDIAQAIKEHLAFEIVDSEMKDFDPRNFVISFERIANLGYRTTATLHDGIADLMRLYSFYRPFAYFKTI
jgi:nucleoside-diphosphate-sugar epimerase